MSKRRIASSVEAALARQAAVAVLDAIHRVPELFGALRGLIVEGRRLAARPDRGFHHGCEDVAPDHRFVADAGSGRYPIAPGLDGIGVRDLAALLTAR